MQSNETTTSAIGGGHMQWGEGGIGRRVVKKNIYIILQIHLKAQHIDSKYNTVMIIELYFYRLPQLELEKPLFAFAWVSNRHKYL